MKNWFIFWNMDNNKENQKIILTAKNFKNAKDILLEDFGLNWEANIKITTYSTYSRALNDLMQKYNLSLESPEINWIGDICNSCFNHFRFTRTVRLIKCYSCQINK